MRFGSSVGFLLVVGCSTAPLDVPAPSRDGGLTARDAGPSGVKDAGSTARDAGLIEAPPDGGPVDPFKPMPDTGEGLTNVSADLAVLLENGALEGACAAYEADRSDRKKKLLCGKWMFFYEHFGTGGVPAVLVDFATQNFPDDIGVGFEKLGMVPDPASMEGRPLGMALGPPAGDVASLVYTCAACHFGRLPDGRYAVGAANHDFEYGKQILSIAVLPQTVDPRFDPTAHHPDALAKLQPLIDTLEADRALRLRLLLDLLPLLGQSQPMFTIEMEGWYASWPAGTMDFLIAPLPLDDGVHTVSKIIPLWDLPDADEQIRAGMPHALLAWTGGAQALTNFLDGFVKIGGGPVDEWPPERLDPLRAYILSLRSPDTSEALDDVEVARGRAAFTSEGCLECHQGPRGSGLRTYTYEEIGTDHAMKRWGDPDLTGMPCCGLGDGQTMLTHEVKSPRLSGVWAAGRLLHNGSLDSLDALFCLDGPRPPSLGDALGTDGHTMTCDLDPATKQALMTFLRSL